MRKFALRCVKKLLREAVLDVYILEDKSHLYLYSTDELEDTLQRLIRRHIAASTGLLTLYMDKDDLGEDISSYLNAWKLVDVTLRGTFSSDVYESHHWIELHEGDVAGLREILVKKMLDEADGET